MPTLPPAGKMFVDGTDALTGTQGTHPNQTHNVNAFDEHTVVHNGGTADTDFRVGWVSPNFQSVEFPGLIDEVAVFNEELTGPALTQLINSGPVSFIPEPSTLALAFLGLLGLTFYAREREKRKRRKGQA